MILKTCQRKSYYDTYGVLSHNGLEYNLIFGLPNDMLRDEKLSWESKGYLSYVAFVGEEIEVSINIIDELIHLGYLVEVKND